MQRLALTTAYEAMEMAGLFPAAPLRLAVSALEPFMGKQVTIGVSSTLRKHRHVCGSRWCSRLHHRPYNYFFKFAVHQACMALWAGETDTAIAGGVNIITDPDNYAGLGNAHFLSKTDNAKSGTRTPMDTVGLRVLDPL
ncbi:hypothetical protein J3459_016006 [Metarhizium acridum]|nr:hypothetical protein J3459_016006 [Metarhizium acridum]